MLKDLFPLNKGVYVMKGIMTAPEGTNVRHPQYNEGDNVRNVKNTKGIMSAHAVFGLGF